MNIALAPIGRALSVLFLSIVLSACGGATILKQAEPNPFPGKSQVRVEQLAFSEDTKGHDDAKRVALAFEREMQEELEGFQFTADTNAETVVIRTTVVEIDGGTSLGITSTSAVLRCNVKFLLGDKLMDEVVFEATTSQDEGVSVGGVNTSGYTGGARSESNAEKMAGYIADYISERANP